MRSSHSVKLKAVQRREQTLIHRQIMNAIAIAIAVAQWAGEVRARRRSLSDHALPRLTGVIDHPGRKSTGQQLD